MRWRVLRVGICMLALMLFIPDQDGQAFAQRRVNKAPVATIFDQYGDLRSCDHTARLDNYAIQLLNDPSSRGYIVVYAPELSSKRISLAITNYLSDTRGLPAERLKTIHAGLNKELTEPNIQLWVVPAGAAPPKPRKHDVNLASIKGKLAEFQDWDGVALDPGDWADFDDFGTGPAVGNVTFAAVDEVLKAQKNAVAHVVGFNGADSIPGAWRRSAESTVESLKKFGIESERFKIAYGGQLDDLKVQIWILPRGESPPGKDPASEPAPAKALQIGSFDDAMLGNAKNELAVFDRLLTIMRENPDLRACLIVRFEVPVPEEPGEADEPVSVIAEPAEPVETNEPVKPEPEHADLPKLVDKWKSELAAKLKIPNDRFVVLFANAPPYRLSSLDVWVVPAAQPLPDPNKEGDDPSDVVQDPKSRP